MEEIEQKEQYQVEENGKDLKKIEEMETQEKLKSNTSQKQQEEEDEIQVEQVKVEEQDVEERKEQEQDRQSDNEQNMESINSSEDSSKQQQQDVEGQQQQEQMKEEMKEDKEQEKAYGNYLMQDEEEIKKYKHLKELIKNHTQEFDQLVDLEQNKKWKLKSDKKGIQLHNFNNDETQEICSRVETKVILKQGARNFMEYFRKIENRYHFDPMFDKGEYIVDLGEQHTIQHWVLKGQTGIVSKRQFSIISKILEDEDNIYLVGKALKFPEGEALLPYSEKLKKMVWCSVNRAGLRLKKLPGDKQEYLMTYLQYSNPNGKIPYMLKKQTSKFAKQMIEKLVKSIKEKNM